MIKFICWQRWRFCMGSAIQTSTTTCDLVSASTMCPIYQQNQSILSPWYGTVPQEISQPPGVRLIIKHYFHQESCNLWSSLEQTLWTGICFPYPQCFSKNSICGLMRCHIYCDISSHNIGTNNKNKNNKPKVKQNKTHVRASNVRQWTPAPGIG